MFLQPTSGDPVLVGTLPLFGLRESGTPDAEHELSYLFDITGPGATPGRRGPVGRRPFRAKLAPVNAVPEDAEPEPEVVIGTIALLIQ